MTNGDNLRMRTSLVEKFVYQSLMVLRYPLNGHLGSNFRNNDQRRCDLYFPHNVGRVEWIVRYKIFTAIDVGRHFSFNAPTTSS